MYSDHDPIQLHIMITDLQTNIKSYIRLHLPPIFTASKYITKEKMITEWENPSRKLGILRIHRSHLPFSPLIRSKYVE